MHGFKRALFRLSHGLSPAAGSSDTARTGLAPIHGALSGFVMPKPKPEPKPELACCCAWVCACGGRAGVRRYLGLSTASVPYLKCAVQSTKVPPGRAPPGTQAIASKERDLQLHLTPVSFLIIPYSALLTSGLQPSRRPVTLVGIPYKASHPTASTPAAQQPRCHHCGNSQNWNPSNRSISRANSLRSRRPPSSLHRSINHTCHNFPG